MELAKALHQSVDDLNVFIQRQGGFDTFAEAGQYTEGLREAYNNRDDAVTSLRRAFDEAVSDKKDFVRKLKEMGEEELAGEISSMFEVFRKKHRL